MSGSSCRVWEGRRESHCSGSDNAVRQRQKEEQLAAEAEQRRKEQLQKNEESFYGIADRMELSQTEAEAYYQILCRDNIFEDGVMNLVGFAIYDFDQNGQKDTVVMVENPAEMEWNGVYGTGRIYFYMNGEEPYCITDEAFPFHDGLYLFSADVDNDGNMELVFEACGTGYGGSALEASEYLYGEGGIAHSVGIAKFIIVWDEDRNSRADKWWVEPWE